MKKIKQRKKLVDTDNGMVITTGKRGREGRRGGLHGEGRGQTWGGEHNPIYR